MDNGFEVKFADFKVSHLKEKLFHEADIKNLIQDKKQMDIYKVDSEKVNDEINNLKGFTEDDIKNKLNGELLTPMFKLERCFNTEAMDQEGINIFIVLTPTGKLVKSFGKNFELYQREDTIGTLWNAIKKRYPYRGEDDKSFHPIPVLAGGPGTGKSRFLNEIKRLLRHYIDESDEKICNGFANMVVINTTYGNGSPANNKDIRFDIRANSTTNSTNGETSLALRILFEYFQPQYEFVKLTFSAFNTLCNKSKAVDFTLDTALEVIHADFIKQSKQETSSCSPLVLVLGIDEFNNLHDLEKNACKDLIKSIGGVMCNSPVKIFFIPILTGTIEGAISKYITGSMHEPILLPLRLLNDDDAINIGYEKINLKTLLKGAEFSHEFLNFEVVLPETKDIKLYKLQHRYPATKTYEKQKAKSANLPDMRNGYFELDLLDDTKKYTGCVFLNAAGAPWDVFVLLKDGSSEF
ncbi:hypothetical protein RhiirA4_487619, partial [Rhizophagus irregularis]